jgi:hypothetical protein
MADSEQKYNFLLPSSYDFDPAKAEVAAGTRLKDLRPPDALAYCNYDSKNFNWSEGSDNGELFGNAAVAGGLLNLNNDDISYEDFASENNIGQNEFAAEFTIIPTADPSVTQMHFFNNFETPGSNNNLISVWWNVARSIFVTMYDKDGILIDQTFLGVWSPTLGQPHYFSLNVNLTGGITRLFIDGVQFGADILATGIRDITSGITRIGSNIDANTKSNFQFDDFAIYDAVQRTGSYTPSPVLSPTIYTLTQERVITLDKIRTKEISNFEHTPNEPGSTTITYNLSKDGVWYYYNGGAAQWLENVGDADVNYNPISVIQANLATFTTVGVEVAIKLKLAGPGDETPEVLNITVGYDYDPPDLNPDLTLVHGEQTSADGEISTEIIEVQLYGPSVEFPDNFQIIGKPIYIQPNVNGTWEQQFMPTESMQAGSFFAFKYKSRPTQYKLVPISDEPVDYNDLEGINPFE